MAKVEYTPEFEDFWKHYPRKVAKGPAFKAWKSQVDEQDAFMSRAVVDDLKKRTRLRWWHPDKTKIPHAATWINARRWEDEGWEDDIKTVGSEQVPTAAPRKYTERIEEDYGLNSFQTMLNRVFKSYLLAAGGFPDGQLEILVKEKNQTYAELRDGIDEEIAKKDGEADKKAARTEMAYLLVDTMLRRLDSITGKNLRRIIMSKPRKRR